VLTLGLYGIFATAAPLNRHQNADNPTPFYSLVVDIQQDHIFTRIILTIIFTRIIIRSVIDLRSDELEPDIMTTHPTPRYTAFDGHRILAVGPLADVALAVKRAMHANRSNPLVFNDRTGQQTDLDLRGDDADIIARHAEAAAGSAPPRQADVAETPDAQPRGRGRPKLGVVPREVTLLPRHWDWLGAQPGGASVALRKLVEQARRDNEAQDQQRQQQEAAYRFMSSMAGDLPGFEEATRALYAGDESRFVQCVKSWPQDVRGYAMSLAWPAQAAA